MCHKTYDIGLLRWKRGICQMSPSRMKSTPAFRLSKLLASTSHTLGFAYALIYSPHSNCLQRKHGLIQATTNPHPPFSVLKTRLFLPHDYESKINPDDCDDGVRGSTFKPTSDYFKTFPERAYESIAPNC